MTRRKLLKQILRKGCFLEKSTKELGTLPSQIKLPLMTANRMKTPTALVIMVCAALSSQGAEIPSNHVLRNERGEASVDSENTESPARQGSLSLNGRAPNAANIAGVVNSQEN
jgi:hypothetical protein